MHWNSSFFAVPKSYSTPRHVRPFTRSAEVSEPSQPGLEVVEHPDHWTVQLDLPGVLLADIDVTLTDGALVISGERKSNVPEGAKVLFDDRSVGKIRRELRVGEGIDQNRIDAELRDGVLKITLFRSAEASPQKITIRNANS